MALTERNIAGIELGGTKCVCILGRADGTLLDEVRFPTLDPETTLGAIEDVLDRWSVAQDFIAIGIASFGPLELDRNAPGFGTILSTPKRGWSGICVTAPFERFGVPIGIETDVVGAARAEQRWGAAEGLTDFAYITVGTGVGVGAIIDDRPVAGLGHGEMGHMRVPRLEGDDWPGVCAFHGDCVEGLASGPAISARCGAPAADEGWQHWATVEHALAMLIHNLFLATQPRRILMGGGVIEGRPSMIKTVSERARASLAGYHTADLLGDDFLALPGLGGSAGPLGAVSIGLEALERQIRSS